MPGDSVESFGVVGMLLRAHPIQSGVRRRKMVRLLLIKCDFRRLEYLVRAI